MSTIDAAKSAKDILSTEEIEKIKQEELLRLQIRNAIEPSEPKKSKFFEFFNSSIGLLLVSGIIIGGIGKLAAMEFDRIKDERETKKSSIKYLTELDERIFQLEFFLIKEDTSKAYDQKRYFSNGLIAVKLGAEQWYHPIFSEFKEVPMQALILWFKLNLTDDQLTESALKKVQLMSVDDSGICDIKKEKDCIKTLKDFETKIQKEITK